MTEAEQMARFFVEVCGWTHDRAWRFVARLLDGIAESEGVVR